MDFTWITGSWKFKTEISSKAECYFNLIITTQGKSKLIISLLSEIQEENVILIVNLAKIQFLQNNEVAAGILMIYNQTLGVLLEFILIYNEMSI